VGYIDICVDEKIGDVKQFSKGTNDWLCNESDDYIRSHINNMVAHSRMIKSACAKNNIRYFDTSDDFVGTIDKAVEYLLTTG
jgi:hypothetical protein